jgi:hypothetical protein
VFPICRRSLVPLAGRCYKATSLDPTAAPSRPALPRTPAAGGAPVLPGAFSLTGQARERRMGSVAAARMAKCWTDGGPDQGSGFRRGYTMGSR